MPKGIFDHVFPDDDSFNPESGEASLYEASQQGMDLHLDYFGKNIEFRSDSNSSWDVITAVVHAEFVKQVRTSTGWTKKIARMIFAQPEALFQLTLNSEVRIGSKIYSVEEINEKSAAKTAVHLTRVEPRDIARPGFRRR